MGSKIVEKILNRVKPSRTTDQIRQILPDILQLREGLLSYEQIVPELKREYQIVIKPEDNPKAAAKNLAAIVWKIQHAKRKPATVPPRLPGMEVTPAATPVDDAQAHGMKALEAMRRREAESKKPIFAPAK